MKKIEGKKNLTLSRETLHSLDQNALKNVGGGLPIIPIIITIGLITMLGGDTPQK